MNLTDKKYSEYALVQEMMDTIGVIKNFDPTQTKNIAAKIQSVGRLLMTGEGSSRIFPAKKKLRNRSQKACGNCTSQQRHTNNPQKVRMSIFEFRALVPRIFCDCIWVCVVHTHTHTHAHAHTHTCAPALVILAPDPVARLCELCAARRGRC